MSNVLSRLLMSPAVVITIAVENILARLDRAVASSAKQRVVEVQRRRDELRDDLVPESQSEPQLFRRLAGH